MADSASPRVNNVVRFFVPGLVLGLVIGGLAGAFLAPMLQSTTPEFKSKPGGPTARPAMQPAPTGSTGATAPEQRQPEAPPSTAPTGTPK